MKRRGLEGLERLTDWSKSGRREVLTTSPERPTTSPLDISKLHYKKVKTAQGDRFVITEDCLDHHQLKILRDKLRRGLRKNAVAMAEEE